MPPFLKMSLLLLCLHLRHTLPLPVPIFRPSHPLPQDRSVHYVRINSSLDNLVIAISNGSSVEDVIGEDDDGVKGNRSYFLEERQPTAGAASGGRQKMSAGFDSIQYENPFLGFHFYDYQDRLEETLTVTRTRHVHAPVPEGAPALHCALISCSLRGSASYVEIPSQSTTDSPMTLYSEDQPCESDDTLAGPSRPTWVIPRIVITDYDRQEEVTIPEEPPVTGQTNPGWSTLTDHCDPGGDRAPAGTEVLNGHGDSRPGTDVLGTPPKTMVSLTDYSRLAISQRLREIEQQVGEYRTAFCQIRDERREAMTPGYIQLLLERKRLNTMLSERGPGKCQASAPTSRILPGSPDDRSPLEPSIPGCGTISDPEFRARMLRSQLYLAVSKLTTPEEETAAPADTKATLKDDTTRVPLCQQQLRFNRYNNYLCKYFNDDTLTLAQTTRAMQTVEKSVRKAVQQVVNGDYDKVYKEHVAEFLLSFIKVLSQMINRQLFNTKRSVTEEHSINEESQNDPQEHRINEESQGDPQVHRISEESQGDPQGHRISEESQGDPQVHRISEESQGDSQEHRINEESQGDQQGHRINEESRGDPDGSVTAQQEVSHDETAVIPPWQNDRSLADCQSDSSRGGEPGGHSVPKKRKRLSRDHLKTKATSVKRRLLAKRKRKSKAQKPNDNKCDAQEKRGVQLQTGKETKRKDRADTRHEAKEEHRPMTVHAPRLKTSPPFMTSKTSRPRMNTGDDSPLCHRHQFSKIAETLDVQLRSQSLSVDGTLNFRPAPPQKSCASLVDCGSHRRQSGHLDGPDRPSEEDGKGRVGVMPEDGVGGAGEELSTSTSWTYRRLARNVLVYGGDVDHSTRLDLLCEPLAERPLMRPLMYEMLCRRLEGHGLRLEELRQFASDLTLQEASGVKSGAAKGAGSGWRFQNCLARHRAWLQHEDHVQSRLKLRLHNLERQATPNPADLLMRKDIERIVNEHRERNIECMVMEHGEEGSPSGENPESSSQILAPSAPSARQRFGDLEEERPSQPAPELPEHRSFSPSSQAPEETTVQLFRYTAVQDTDPPVQECQPMHDKGRKSPDADREGTARPCADKAAGEVPRNTRHTEPFSVKEDGRCDQRQFTEDSLSPNAEASLMKLIQDLSAQPTKAQLGTEHGADEGIDQGVSEPSTRRSFSPCAGHTGTGKGDEELRAKPGGTERVPETRGSGEAAGRSGDMWDQLDRLCSAQALEDWLRSASQWQAQEAFQGTATGTSAEQAPPSGHMQFVDVVLTDQRLCDCQKVQLLDVGALFEVHHSESFWKDITTLLRKSRETSDRPEISSHLQEPAGPDEGPPSRTCSDRQQSAQRKTPQPAPDAGDSDPPCETDLVPAQQATGTDSQGGSCDHQLTAGKELTSFTTVRPEAEEEFYQTIVSVAVDHIQRGLKEVTSRKVQDAVIDPEALRQRAKELRLMMEHDFVQSAHSAPPSTAEEPHPSLTGEECPSLNNPGQDPKHLTCWRKHSDDGNRASQIVLEGTGFQPFGLAPGPDVFPDLDDTIEAAAAGLPRLVSSSDDNLSFEDTGDAAPTEENDVNDATRTTRSQGWSTPASLLGQCPGRTWSGSRDKGGRRLHPLTHSVPETAEGGEDPAGPGSVVGERSRWPTLQHEEDDDWRRVFSLQGQGHSGDVRKDADREGLVADEAWALYRRLVNAVVSCYDLMDRRALVGVLCDVTANPDDRPLISDDLCRRLENHRRNLGDFQRFTEDLLQLTGETTGHQPSDQNPTEGWFPADPRDTPSSVAPAARQASPGRTRGQVHVRSVQAVVRETRISVPQRVLVLCAGALLDPDRSEAFWSEVNQILHDHNTETRTSENSGRKDTTRRPPVAPATGPTRRTPRTVETATFSMPLKPAGTHGHHDNRDSSQREVLQGTGVDDSGDPPCIQLAYSMMLSATQHLESAMRERRQQRSAGMHTSKNGAGASPLHRDVDRDVMLGRADRMVSALRRELAEMGKDPRMLKTKSTGGELTDKDRHKDDEKHTEQSGVVTEHEKSLMKDEGAGLGLEERVEKDQNGFLTGRAHVRSGESTNRRTAIQTGIQPVDLAESHRSSPSNESSRRGQQKSVNTMFAQAEKADDAGPGAPVNVPADGFRAVHLLHISRDLKKRMLKVIKHYSSSRTDEPDFPPVPDTSKDLSPEVLDASSPTHSFQRVSGKSRERLVSDTVAGDPSESSQRAVPSWRWLPFHVPQAMCELSRDVEQTLAAVAKTSSGEEADLPSHLLAEEEFVIPRNFPQGADVAQDQDLQPENAGVQRNVIGNMTTIGKEDQGKDLQEELQWNLKKGLKDVKVETEMEDVKEDHLKTNTEEDLKTDLKVVDAKTEDLKTEDLTTKDCKMEDQKAPDQKTESLKAEDQKTESLKAEDQKTESLKAEDKKTESLKAEDKKTESLKAEDLKTESLKAEDLKTKSLKAEDQKTESLKAEDLKTESLKAEDQQTESLKAKDLKTESLKAEDKKTESLKAEDPKTESLKAEDQKTESLKAEDKKTESLKAEDQKTESLKAEDQKTESLKAEDKKTESLKAEDQKTESLKAEDKKTESLKPEDMKTESLKAEDMKTESLKAEDLKTESLKAKDLKTESLKAEDQQTESLKAEDLKTESLKAEDKKTESLKAEDQKTESLKAEDQKTESLKAEDQKTESLKAENKKTESLKAEDKKTESLKPEDMKTESLKAEDKKTESLKAEDKKTESLKAEDQKTEDKKTESLKAEDLKTEDKKTEELDLVWSYDRLVRAVLHLRPWLSLELVVELLAHTVSFGTIRHRNACLAFVTRNLLQYASSLALLPSAPQDAETLGGKVDGQAGQEGTEEEWRRHLETAGWQLLTYVQLVQANAPTTHLPSPPSPSSLPPHHRQPGSSRDPNMKAKERNPPHVWGHHGHVDTDEQHPQGPDPDDPQKGWRRGEGRPDLVPRHARKLLKEAVILCFNPVVDKGVDGPYLEVRTGHIEGRLAAVLHLAGLPLSASAASSARRHCLQGFRPSRFLSSASTTSTDSGSGGPSSRESRAARAEDVKTRLWSLTVHRSDSSEMEEEGSCSSDPPSSGHRAATGARLTRAARVVPSDGNDRRHETRQRVTAGAERASVEQAGEMLAADKEVEHKDVPSAEPSTRDDVLRPEENLDSTHQTEAETSAQKDGGEAAEECAPGAAVEKQVGVEDTQRGSHSDIGPREGEQARKVRPALLEQKAGTPDTMGPDGETSSVSEKFMTDDIRSSSGNMTNNAKAEDQVLSMNDDRDTSTDLSSACTGEYMTPDDVMSPATTADSFTSVEMSSPTSGDVTSDHFSSLIRTDEEDMTTDEQSFATTADTTSDEYYSPSKEEDDLTSEGSPVPVGQNILKTRTVAETLLGRPYALMVPELCALAFTLTAPASVPSPAFRSQLTRVLGRYGHLRPSLLVEVVCACVLLALGEYSDEDHRAISGVLDSYCQAASRAESCRQPHTAARTPAAPASPAAREHRSASSDTLSERQDTSSPSSQERSPSARGTSPASSETSPDAPRAVVSLADRGLAACAVLVPCLSFTFPF